MTSSPAIEADRLCKAYRIWETPAARLVSPLWSQLAGIWPEGSALHRGLTRRAQRSYRDFWALRELSFTVNRGESVGIVGRNGSGKSTLMQLIAGTLRPSGGSARISGRVAALLELGSGFNPEFTGRENVYLNGSVLGLTREEIDARFPAIAAFSEIGDFIEEPVKIYSSGMIVRLAFAVAAHVNPQILIIDEALSVGDSRFQLKCARAIDRFLEEGGTLLFVSHDLSTVKRLCQRAILLEQGQLVYEGHPNDVVNLYSKLIADGGSLAALRDDLEKLRRGGADAGKPAAPPARASGVSTEPRPALSAETQQLALRLRAMEVALQSHPSAGVLQAKVDQLLASENLHRPISGSEFAYGGELGRIVHVEIRDAQGVARPWFTTGESVSVAMEVEADERLEDPIFALTIKNAAGVEIYGTNTLFANQPATPIAAGERRTVRFSFDFAVMPGDYFLSFGFTHFFGEQLTVIHRRYDAIKVEVHGVDRTFGIANLRARIVEEPAAAPAE